MRLGTVVAVIVTIVLAGAVWTVVKLNRAPAPPRPAANAADTLAGGDELVERALDQIPGIDSTLIKNEWKDDLPGVDVTALGGLHREIFLRHANARRCTCGCGYTLAACRTYDTTCPVSGPILETLRDSVLAGHIKNANGLRKRPTRG